MDKSINESWVERHLRLLADNIKAGRSHTYVLFEPDDRFYALFRQGDEGYLNHAVRLLCRHVGQNRSPAACYEWDLRIPINAAGTITHTTHGDLIRVPVSLAGRPDAIGATLAHEVSHAVLFDFDMGPIPESEHEPFTDFAAVFLGFGKLLLNGIQMAVSPTTGLGVSLGYLSPGMIAYAYREVIRMYMISDAIARAGLNDAGLLLLDLN